MCIILTCPFSEFHISKTSLSFFYPIARNYHFLLSNIKILSFSSSQFTSELKDLTPVVSSDGHGIGNVVGSNIMAMCRARRVIDRVIGGIVS